MKFKHITLVALALFVLGLVVGLVAFRKNIFRDNVVYAATVQELQTQIDAHNDTIKKLEAEIAQYTQELDKTSTQAKTLQSAVSDLDTNVKKIGTDIAVTETKIDSTNLTITKLKGQISQKELNILENRDALSQSLRKLNEADSKSMLEVLFSYPSMSAFWNEMEVLNQFQAKVKEHLNSLIDFKAGLEVDKSNSEVTKSKLEQLRNQLADQRKIVEVAKAEKAKLLADTKNQESNYKKIIADKVAKKKAFEQELLQYESQLKFAIDPKSLPGVKAGILGWPTSSHTITQYFGRTEFAAAHTQLYNGSGHNGIDIGIPIGTPILAAEAGTVQGTGDTDAACPGASYGKWVFVQHNNGLSTLYAHLSVIKVSQGQNVSRGETLGFSGATGYATGPHLHFTVYATQGARIISRPSAACGGKTYTLPVADLKAYLDPMGYL